MCLEYSISGISPISPISTINIAVNSRYNSSKKQEALTNDYSSQKLLYILQFVFSIHSLYQDMWGVGEWVGMRITQIRAPIPVSTPVF